MNLEIRIASKWNTKQRVDKNGKWWPKKYSIWDGTTKKAHVLLRVKQHKKEGKWLWEGREGMAYLNVKFGPQLRTLLQHTSNGYSRLSTYDDSTSKPKQEIPQKQQFDISPPQVSIDFSQVSTDPPPLPF